MVELIVIVICVACPWCSRLWSKRSIKSAGATPTRQWSLAVMGHKLSCRA